MTTTMTVDTQETLAIDQFAKDSYLNYSMYVIMDRSLPHIGDGFKPVHRRLVYAMNQLRLDANAKYKKSARTVGDTLGKYHPHGDSACYEAMVLMAQPFATRIPLVDGQGNWGSQDDPKSFAAMRYTEAKLTKYASTLLDEINQDTVEWKPNFDGTMKEPVVLPAQLPNILINGTTGIAVGMATDIPPHNVNEVTEACILMLQKPKTGIAEIMEIIQGPDYPTGGEVINSREDIIAAYSKGEGKVLHRASYEVDGDHLIITSLPYQVGGTKVLTEIADLVDKKKFNLITQIRDDSDEKCPVRIILTLRSSKTDAEAVMNHLFANTSLEVSHKINLNMIGLNEKPEVKNIETIIREWCQFRQQVFERKKRFRLNAVESRLHIVDGLITAYLNLDEVIRIIREEESPKSVLMDSFKLTDIQATAILDLRLRQLSKLQEHELRSEQEKLSEEQQALVTLLADDKKIRRAIVTELKTALKAHTNERRTLLIEKKPAALVAADIALTPASDVTVILSEKRWWRTTKGHDADVSKLNFKHGDKLHSTLETRSNMPIIFMSTSGRFFSLVADEMPNGKSVGEPASARFNLEGGDNLELMLPYCDDKLLLTTAKGNAFFAQGKDLNTRAKKGKEVLKLTDGDTALPPFYMGDKTHIMALTQAGRIIVVDANEINVSSKSQGVRLIDIKSNEFDANEDSLTQVLPITLQDTVEVMVGKRKFNIKPDKLSYYTAKRARRGLFFENRGTGNADISISIK